MFGDYYTPNIVSGAPQTSMIGNQIDLYFHGGPQPTIGAAITLVLAAFLPSSWATTCGRSTGRRGRPARHELARRRLVAAAGPPRGASSPAGSRTLGAVRASSPRTWLYVAWALVPMLAAVLFSFNAAARARVWEGFSTPLVLGRPIDFRLPRPDPSNALVQSLELAVARHVIATPLGLLLAIGLSRWRGRGSGPSNFLMLLPLATPELAMGVSLLLVFTELFTFVGTGTTAQVIGHVTFSLSYVVVIVRGRLFSIGTQYEEAARIWAPPVQALRRVLLPLLLPATSPAPRSSSRSRSTTS